MRVSTPTAENDVTKSTNQHSQQEQTCCPVVELRQYTLHPGKRDVLIELFDREFIESQELLGMYVIGQFRDLDDPNRFVWLRGFRNMSERAEGLTAFYGGPVWQANRETANATMIDSDNVLLLRPARPSSGFMLENTDRPEPDAKEIPPSLVVATIYYLDASAQDDFVDFFERTVKPALTNTGASVSAYFVTESSANNFPALPVREGENVFVWFSCFRDQAAYENYVVALPNSAHSREASEELAHRLRRKPELLKLSPTARSQRR
jgi:quinol monooxygenase YgiN